MSPLDKPKMATGSGMRKLVVVTAGAVTLCVTSLPAAGMMFVVGNTNDSGPGSLRQAVADANSSMGVDQITFAVTGTIALTSGEIAITDSVNIDGPGARQLAITSTARIFNIPNLASIVEISGLTLSGASATSNGGAIAIDHQQVTLRFVTLSGNKTTGEGGAIFNNGGVLTIENSTISGNQANKAGAIYTIGFTLNLTNSTVSGNMATDSVGGIKFEFAFGSISNSTIAGNTAGFSQGGILFGTGSHVLGIVSSIVAGNTDGAGASDLARFSGTINASTSLFQQNLTAGTINGTNTGNLVGVDPRLLVLTSNGGPTDTQALGGNSPAINRGSNPMSLIDDQRGPGFARQVGPATDIGAFEVQPAEGAPALSPLALAGLSLALLCFGGHALSRRHRRRA
jgi:hypothetical protein